MEDSGPPQVLLTALWMLIGVAIVAMAVWRGERARAQQDDDLNRSRARRTYWCFVAFGVLTTIIAVALLATARRSSDEREGYGMLLGFFVGIPAALAFIIGTFQALMVWRLPLVRLLLLATVLASILCFSGALPDRWCDIIGVGYALLIVGVSLRGLSGMREDATISGLGSGRSHDHPQGPATE